MVYLGFDTSNYTTSVAACTDEGIINIRRILSVRHGERGLRQSDAVFQHMKEMPELFNSLTGKIDSKKIKAIGVSTRPRSVSGSYMPVFLAGKGYARVCSDTLGVPLYEFSHQDGHIMAGIHSSGCFELLGKPFISVHLSGGTCEILYTKYEKSHFLCDIIGGTRDISAGQLIDRVGVALGMDFPCGKEMEKLALLKDKEIKLPVNTDKSYINFSGIETKTLSLIKTEKPENLSYSVFISVAKALCEALKHSTKEHNLDDILIVGGVASNSIIKEYLLKNINEKLHFASVEYSTDNAAGISLMAKMMYENNEGK